MATTSEVTAVIQPDNASDQSVSWESDNEDVATVTKNNNPATITAVDVGSCTVTVTTNDGGFTDTVSVTVIEPAVSGVDAQPGEVELEAP